MLFLPVLAQDRFYIQQSPPNIFFGGGGGGGVTTKLQKKKKKKCARSLTELTCTKCSRFLYHSSSQLPWPFHPVNLLLLESSQLNRSDHQLIIVPKLKTSIIITSLYISFVFHQVTSFFFNDIYR